MKFLKLFLVGVFFASSAFSEPVEDNSFLVEEAYNQEPGVVQFINVYQKSKKTNDWNYVFINEIPVVSQAHQFSYEIPYSHIDSVERTAVGDVKLNYRNEFVRKDAFVTTGRFSLTIPTGKHKDGFGSDATGYEISLLNSVQVAEKWVQHWNAGGAFTQKAKDVDGNSADNSKFFWNLSNVFLLTDNLNFMLEMTTAVEESTIGKDQAEWTSDVTVSPSVRYAINIGQWQFVPGLALPVNIGPNPGQTNQTLAYLSIEGQLW